MASSAKKQRTESESGATAAAAPAAPSITRIIRFLAPDGSTCLGEEPSVGATRAELLAGDIFEPASLRKTGESKDIVSLLAPVVPSNIFCIGLNYMKHYEESAKKRGIALPGRPVVFMKPSSTLLAPHGDM